MSSSGLPATATRSANIPLRNSSDLVLQMLGETQEHVAAGLGTARLKKAQMLNRNLGFRRQIELADTAALAPVAQERRNARPASR